MASGDILGRIASQTTSEEIYQKVTDINNSLEKMKPGIAEFTEDGTFTVPAGVTLISITACGGGGGGGGSLALTNTSVSLQVGSGGGGGGDVIIKKEYTVTPGQVLDITIGKGGAYGTPAAGGSERKNGGNGGATVIGNLVTLQGGYGGQGIAHTNSSYGGIGGGSGGNGEWGRTSSSYSSDLSQNGANGMGGVGGRNGCLVMLHLVSSIYNSSGGGGGGGSLGKGGDGSAGLKNTVYVTSQDGTLGGGGGGGCCVWNIAAEDLEAEALKARGGNGGDGYVKIQWGV